MRLVFMGTPRFAVPSLRRLHEAGYEIAAVITQPDRPRGRGHRPSPTEVAAEAEALGLPVLKPVKVSDPELVDALRRLGPEAIVLVAFGQLIPRSILDLPPLGCINLHPSLLPRYRGASPIHAAILAGDSETGVTTMRMDEGLDTGDILLQERVPIGPDDNAGDLHDRLAEIGAGLLLETLERLQRGTLTATPQDHSRASYAGKVQKVEIDWSGTGESVARTIRGLSPSPGVYTFRQGVRLKLHRARALPDGQGVGAPGEVVQAGDEGIQIACGSGAVLVTELQPEGKSIMSAGDYVRGYRVRPGEVWGSRA